MKKTAFLIAAILGLAAVSCTKESSEDITPYNDAVSQMNSDLQSLNVIVLALQKDYYVNTVSTLASGTVLSFSNGSTASVKEAAPCEIATPAVSVKFSDGYFYWTLDGELAVDGNGATVLVNSNAPVLKYEGKQWSISYDGSVSFQVIEASASKYSGLFKSFQAGDNAAIVTLVGGVELEVPLKTTFSLAVNSQDVACYPGASIEVPYTVYGASNPTVSCSASGDYTATVKKGTATTGVVVITAGSDGEQGSVKLSATNSVKTVEKSITVCKGQIIVKDLYKVDAAGGKLEIELETNLDYTVKSDADWITVDQTKVAMRKETISVSVAENKAGDPERTAEIQICGTDGTVLQRVSVTQKAVRVEVVYAYASYDAQSLAPSISVSGATTEADWITVESDGKLTLTENTGLARKATVKGGEKNLCVIQNPGTAFLDLSFEKADGNLATKNADVMNVGTASKLATNATKAFTAFENKEKNYSKPVTIVKDDTLGHKVAWFHNEQCPTSYGSVIFARANEQNVKDMWNGFTVEAVMSFDVALWNKCGGKKGDEANVFCYKATTSDTGIKSISLGVYGDESGAPVISFVLNGTRSVAKFAMEENTYYHVALTFDKTSQNVTLYVNGNQELQIAETRDISTVVPFGSSSPWWGSIGNNLPNPWILGGYLNGQWQVPNINWCGKLATFRIYSSTLSADDVMKSYGVTASPFADLY